MRFALSSRGAGSAFSRAMSRIVTFGEIMLRLSTPQHQRFAQADQFEIHAGGAEANVAVALAQLGADVEFVTRLPKNELGQRCLDELRRLRVNLAHTAIGGERLGLYFVEHGAGQRTSKVLYDRAQSSMATAGEGDFLWAKIFAGARWFHWSGITPALSESCRAIVADACATAKRLGLTVSFDVNYRAKLWSPEQAGAALAPLMPFVDICVCGLGEARSVFGVAAVDEETAAAELSAKFGFRSILIPQRVSDSASTTSWAASLFVEGVPVASRRYEIDIIDRVGAGDALTGALIFSLERGDSPQTAVDFAVAASALKHTIPGDFNLVTLAEVEALAAGGNGGRVER